MGNTDIYKLKPWSFMSSPRRTQSNNSRGCKIKYLTSPTFNGLIEKDDPRGIRQRNRRKIMRL